MLNLVGLHFIEHCFMVNFQLPDFSLQYALLYIILYNCTGSYYHVMHLVPSVVLLSYLSVRPTLRYHGCIGWASVTLKVIT